jgi:two-component system, OmpR family, alkaline phosphatase synthesis response regulator PhoP
MTRILIIEDNADLAFGLQRTLEFEGYEVLLAEDGTDGLEQVRSAGVHLVLLDLMLPGMNGFEILRALRAEGSRVPVLVLTARGDETDVVMGFQSGADDYVTKPFSTLELVARVRALLRRGAQEENGGTAPAARVRFGEIELDTSTRTITRSGEPVQLSPKEFDLLLALVRRHGQVASRAELLDEVWRYANTSVMTRTVDIHIAELRRKLEDDPSQPRHLLTVRKAGYRLEA